MYWRFQADNFFVTTITNDQTLIPWQDGVINALELPNIESWKNFFVIFRVDNSDSRFALPVYMENGQIKYKGYNVKFQTELKAYDTISLNDLAENFNYLFDNTDDIGSVIKKWWLDVLVLWWRIIRWWVNIWIADTDLTLTDNTTWYIVFDYTDSRIKFVETLDNLSHCCFAKVVTFWWEISSLETRKWFNWWEIFSNLFFVRNETTWAIEIKDWALTKDNIDLSSLTTDDIPEWDENKYFPESAQNAIADLNNKKHTHSNKSILDTITQTLLDSFAKKTSLSDYQLISNLKQNLSNPSSATYPSTQAVYNAIRNLWVWDMLKSTYDPNNIEKDVFNLDNILDWVNKWTIIKSDSAPSNPTIWTTWYDTVNHILKSYNWTGWDNAWYVAYNDFDWKNVSWSNIYINYPNIKASTSWSVNVYPWLQINAWSIYLLRIDATADTTLNLKTGITNPNGLWLTIPAWYTKMFSFLAINDSTLEMQWYDLSKYPKTSELSRVAFSWAYNDLTWRPSLAAVATSWRYSDLAWRPSFAAVATSWSYEDLNNRPTIWNWTITLRQNWVNMWSFSTNQTWSAIIDLNSWYTGRTIASDIQEASAWWEIVFYHNLWQIPRHIDIEWYVDIWPSWNQNTATRFMMTRERDWYNAYVDLLWTKFIFSDWTNPWYTENLTLEDSWFIVRPNAGGTQTFKFSCAYHTKCKLTAYL